MQNTLDITLLNELSKSYINGQWVDGKSGKKYEIKDPFDNSVITSVRLANQRQIKEAFTTAKEAQKKWKKSTAEERRNILIKALNYLKDNKEEIIASSLFNV